MPDGPYTTPEEEGVMRLLNQAGGSPTRAAQNLFQRLAALEAEIAALEAAVQAEATATSDSEDDA